MDTIMNADSCEFCPHERDLVVCGTYMLDATANSRKGSIQLLKVDTRLVCECVGVIRLECECEWSV